MINLELISRDLSLSSVSDNAWRALLGGLLKREPAARWAMREIGYWLQGLNQPPAATSVPITPAFKSFVFDGRSFNTAEELGNALAENWDKAEKRLSLELVACWLETAFGDEKAASSLRSIALDRHLDLKGRLSMTLLVLSPDLPLVWDGALVRSAADLQPAHAVLLSGSSPEWLKRLRGETWLLEKREAMARREREILRLLPDVQRLTLDQLAWIPDEVLKEEAVQKRARFAGSTRTELNVLFDGRELSAGESGALLACDTALFFTEAALERRRRAENLEQWGFCVDRRLAQRLLESGEWLELEPLWTKTREMWNIRKRWCLAVSSPKIEKILQKEKAGFEEAVAVVSNRLDFVNSLGMRFVPVSGLKILMSVLATRRADFDQYCKGAGVHAAPSKFATHPEHPAVNVSWDQARGFCEWLTELERAAGKIGPKDEYRPPTDYEWSLSAGLENEPPGGVAEKSGAIQSRFAWGSEWPPPRSWAEIKIPAPPSLIFSAGSLPPNLHGIHELGCNIMEWCQDGPERDEQTRVVRGCSWTPRDPQAYWLSTRRIFSPVARSESLGFRCVLVPKSLRPVAPSP
jgi:hypothetical protein